MRLALANASYYFHRSGVHLQPLASHMYAHKTPAQRSLLRTCALYPCTPAHHTEEGNSSAFLSHAPLHVVYTDVVLRTCSLPVRHQECKFGWDMALDPYTTRFQLRGGCVTPGIFPYFPGLFIRKCCTALGPFCAQAISIHHANARHAS